MPMKLNCGWSQKVGQPDFGSLGASVNLELEIESDVIRQPQMLRRKLEYLFGQAREAVEAELQTRQNGASGNGHVPHGQVHDGNGHDNGRHNGHRNGDPNGPTRRNGRPSRPATQSQVRALYAITNRQRIDLNGLLREQFSLDRPEDLAIAQASTLIDRLKAAPEGAGGRA